MRLQFKIAYDPENENSPLAPAAHSSFSDALNVWQHMTVPTTVLFDESKQNTTQESYC